MLGKNSRSVISLHDFNANCGILILFLLTLSAFPCTIFANSEDSLSILVNNAKTLKEKEDILLNRAMAYERQKNTVNSLRLERQAYALAKNAEPEDKATEMRALRLIGDNYMFINNYDSAFFYFKEAIDLGKNGVNKKESAYTLLDMGSVLMQMHDYPKGSEYILKALESFKAIAFRKGIIQAEISFANIKTMTEQYDDALKYYLDALKLNNDSSKYTTNYIYNNIGAIYISKNEPDKALFYINTLYRNARKSGDITDLAGALENMGEIWMKMKNYDSAESYLKQSITYAMKPRGDKNAAVAAYQNLSSLFDTKGNPALALKYYKNYTTLKDSLYTQETASHIADLEEKYQAREKQQQIDVLNEQQEVKNAELRQSRQFLYFAAGGILLIALLAVIFYFTSLKLRKLNTRLNEQKKEITLEKEKTEQLNKLKDKLFSILSHDLRSPLISTHALLELLRGNRINEEKFELLSGKLEQTLQQNIHLLDNLLSWAADQIKGMSLNRKEIDVRHLVEESLQDVMAAADKKNINVCLDACAQATVLADLSMNRLVLRNLLSNAIKYTPAGGKVTLSCHVQDKYARITVCDTGTGIEPELKEQLFHSSLIKSEPGTNAERGFGIGLSLCKEFVEKNGGNIWVESEPGKGSSFSFTIPLNTTDMIEPA